MNPSPFYQRAPGILTAEFAPARVVFNTATRMPYILNGAASEIWSFCERPRSEKSLVRYLRLRYGLDAAQAQRDVGGFIKELKERGLLKKI